MYRKHWQTAVALGFILASGLLFGLAVGRWLAENLYLASPLLLHWLPSAVISVAAMASLLFISVLALRRGRSRASLLAMVSCCLPLWLLAIYVLPREVNTVRGSVLVVGSLILVAALSLARLAPTRWRERGTLVVAFVFPLAVYLATLAPTVGQHDTFEFQVLSYQLGIAHPTGYPLYIMLGKLFTFLPLGNVAYRVNLSSAVFAAASVALLYATIKLLTGDRWASLLAALSFGFGCAFWSQAVEAEVYALNALFVCALCYLLIRVSLGARANPSTSTRTTEDQTSRTSCTCLRQFSSRQRMVLLAAFVFGLSLTHHRTILLLAPAILAYAIVNRGWQMLKVRHLAAVATAFLCPLLTIHLYIPVRWWQIHGQSMAWQQFADLVLGRQFAAALTWTAFLDDPLRPMILARSLVEQYPLPALVLAAVGILCLLGRRAQQRAHGSWREALFLLLAFAAYSLFGLSYYVPDVSLFLIPAFA
ncbi:MAG TPA: DUF2723 domain-containing protein, partial [Chloroflexi bacterium]|nr:DUF2723 domain-containing protein [Chloroflexota bacterium]